MPIFNKGLRLILSGALAAGIVGAGALPAHADEFINDTQIIAAEENSNVTATFKVEEADINLSADLNLEGAASDYWFDWIVGSGDDTTTVYEYLAKIAEAKDNGEATVAIDGAYWWYTDQPGVNNQTVSLSTVSNRDGFYGMNEDETTGEKIIEVTGPFTGATLEDAIRGAVDAHLAVVATPIADPTATPVVAVLGELPTFIEPDITLPHAANVSLSIAGTDVNASQIISLDANPADYWFDWIIGTGSDESAVLENFAKVQEAILAGETSVELPDVAWWLIDSAPGFTNPVVDLNTPSNRTAFVNSDENGNVIGRNIIVDGPFRNNTLRDALNTDDTQLALVITEVNNPTAAPRVVVMPEINITIDIEFAAGFNNKIAELNENYLNEELWFDWVVGSVDQTIDSVYSILSRINGAIAVGRDTVDLGDRVLFWHQSTAVGQSQVALNMNDVSNRTEFLDNNDEKLIDVVFNSQNDSLRQVIADNPGAQLGVVVTALDGTLVDIIELGELSQGFYDVDLNSDFGTEIAWLLENGITTGFEDGTFRPVDSISRDAVIAFLYRMAGSPAIELPEVPTFSDVDKNHPFYTEIEWAYQEGITEGYPSPFARAGEREFRPSNPISRDALAAFLYRDAHVQDVDFENSFIDVNEDHPFYNEISWLQSVGITNGWTIEDEEGNEVQEFRPELPIERQAVAAFLYRAVSNGIL